MSVFEGSIALCHDFDRPAEDVFAAWSDERAQLAWGDPGNGWSMEFDAFRFAVGETDMCRFGPVDGPQYVNENRYLLIEPSRRIVYSTSLATAGRLTFAGTVAIDLESTANGTQLRLVEQGLYFDEQDDVEGHRTGWTTMLDALARYLRR